MPKVFIYQIKSFYTKPADLDPAYYGVLDNSANERPDWYEYWPIRKFLLNETLDEDAFYGFFSPSFKAKTNLSSSAVYDFVDRQGDGADIILFTPSLHLTAYYWNVFHYGEACHPGLLMLATKFFARIGQPTNLDDLVTHSQIEVYSNYFIAKPKFWRAWLEITEQLIAFAESQSDPLAAELRKKRRIGGHENTEIKIFIMERIPTWLLARESKFTVKVRDPFVVRSRLYKVPGAVICDGLKIAYATQGRREEYRVLFDSVSRIRKPMGFFIRAGSFLGIPGMRVLMTTLGEYWKRADKT